jgi:PD-(D/E)XK nuclease superfamily
MSERRTPNLFDYAQKELSQDAMICWLLAWAYEEGDLAKPDEMGTMSREFAARLLGKHPNYKGISADQVLKVSRPESQFPVDIPSSPRKRKGRIDVCAEVQLKSGAVILVVEDKTETSDNAKKLTGYLEALKGNKDVIGIYFKTGLITDYDRGIAQESKYAVFSIDDIVEFLTDCQQGNPLLREYREHMVRKHGKSVAMKRDAMSGDPQIYNQALGTAEGQWAFMECVFRRQGNRRAIDAYSFGGGGKTWMKNGSSKGTPWTSFIFRSTPICGSQGSEEKEFLWYRLDWRRSSKGEQAPFLSLRKYWKHGGKPADRNQARKARDRYVKAAQEALKRMGDPSLEQAGKPRDSSGNEQQIVAFDLDGDRNTPDNLRDYLPGFHEAFLKELDRTR